ncbi:hypothetical protein HN803_05685 [candidate division WWE3 bacterium]|jgi:NDP-sugar pyrophosphorylase family protein|nr:hypothetical protein [candidate division WWE3 bacterium]MBT7350251.1 hypothetical protein [candidate division WWE3 bacterium]
MSKTKTLKAIIPAATKGNRMKPLSDFLPKTLLPIDGKELIIDHTLKFLEKVGVTDVCIVLEEKFYDVVQESIDRGYKGTCKIHYKVQKEINGIGFALLMFEEEIGDSNFILMFPDIFHPELDNLDVEIFQNPHIVALPNIESNKYVGNWAVETDGESVKGFTYMTEDMFKADTHQSVHSPLTLPPEVFSKLAALKEDSEKYQNGEFQLVDAIQALIDDGIGFKMTTAGGYFKNINSIEDYGDVLRYHVCGTKNISTLL